MLRLGFGGLSGPQYLGMLSITLVSMFAGATCVHVYYKPDLVRLLRGLAIDPYRPSLPRFRKRSC